MPELPVRLRIVTEDRTAGLPGAPDRVDAGRVAVIFDGPDGQAREVLEARGGATWSAPVEGEAVQLVVLDPMMRFRLPYALDPGQPADRKAVDVAPGSKEVQVLMASRRWLVLDVGYEGWPPPRAVEVLARYGRQEQRRLIELAADRPEARTAFFFDHEAGAGASIRVSGDGLLLRQASTSDGGEQDFGEGAPLDLEIRELDRVVRLTVIPSPLDEDEEAP